MVKCLEGACYCSATIIVDENSEEPQPDGVFNFVHRFLIKLLLLCHLGADKEATIL